MTRNIALAHANSAVHRISSCAYHHFFMLRLSPNYSMLYAAVSVLHALGIRVPITCGVQRRECSPYLSCATCPYMR